MAKSFTVTLDEKVYTLRKFNLGQMEEMAELMESLSPTKVGFAVFRMALRRADPPIPDVDDLEISQQEFEDALGAIMTASGMKRGAAKGEALAPAGRATGAGKVN